MSQSIRIALAACVYAVLSQPASAAPKLDKETCEQLRTDQAKFIQSGILADLQRGPEWAKTNLAAERIREIELFISLDEQIKFGCRDVTLTGDALRAGEAARRLELNPNLDPTQPPPAPEQPDQKAGDDAVKSDTTESGDAAEAAPAVVGEPAVKAVVKPKTERQSAPAAKPKAAKTKADDAYVPPPGTESTRDAPAVSSEPSGTDDTGDTAAP